MFPGQGSQSAGMARGLLRDFAPARALLEQAEQICGLPLNQIRQFGPTNELARPEVLEPLLTAVNIGYAMLLLDRHIEPDVVAGYSAGEVAALFASGVLSPEDALQAATIRGKQLSFAVSDQCKMVAVTRLSGEQILDAIHKANKTGVEIAGWNAPDQLTIVGPLHDVLEMERILIRLGGDTTQVDVNGPWHSTSLKSVSERIHKALGEVNFRKPNRILLSSLSGCRQDEPAAIRRHLSEQVSSPVLWKHILHEMRSLGVTRFCELGSGRVLFGLMRRNFSDTNDYEVSSTESHSAGIAAWIRKHPHTTNTISTTAAK